jgi:tRNA threonylcarbamoyladenosine modification (KEOPS) complex  Pcc1 subunit
MADLHQCELRIPFPNEKLANIAFTTMSVDKEPKRSHVKKQLKVEDNVLLVSFEAEEARMLRVAVGSFLDLLTLTIDTMDRFG